MILTGLVYSQITMPACDRQMDRTDIWMAVTMAIVHCIALAKHSTLKMCMNKGISINSVFSVL